MRVIDQQGASLKCLSPPGIKTLAGTGPLRTEQLQSAAGSLKADGWRGKEVYHVFRLVLL